MPSSNFTDEEVVRDEHKEMGKSHFLSESLRDSFPRVQNDYKETTKKKEEKIKALRSVISISDTIKPPEMAISTDYLLRIFFDFPDVKTMMFKVHPSYSQELEHLFLSLQAKNAFKDNLRKRDRTIKNISMQPVDY